MIFPYYSEYNRGYQKEMMRSMTDHLSFFQSIPPIHNISEITNIEHYYDVPADWHIVITDVRSSTKAIEEGRYRDVNSVAAASITAMLNVAKDVDIPFVFGGDGATVLIPPVFIPDAQRALRGTQILAREQFNLDLRTGIIPVREVLEAKLRIRVARLKVSNNFQQAIFSGGGLAYAEQLLKSNPDKYAPPPSDDTPFADFHGFECRWQEIPSMYDENVTLMVMALVTGTIPSNTVYSDVLAKIDQLYGNSASRAPITVKNLRLAFNPNKLKTEAKVRSGDTSWRTLRQMWINSLKAWFAMRFKIGRWGDYKSILVDSTDSEKFDDTLRMVMSGRVSQREQLRAYLEEQRQAGRLVYGMHISRHALMTCVVFDYFGRQVHFVDGARGGYALAAREMKQQLAELQKGEMTQID
ncbi:MAG: hypothetical protein CUN52_07445 [Phototrophicales bacterium]|nr:MAG: hypothetical protein CUN52_07445 [Phototrophicales bacterium]